MRFNLGKFHKRANLIFDRENLGEQKQRIVAFVLDSRGHILTEGWNSYTKTHPLQLRASLANKEAQKCYLHAEIRALTKLSYKQEDKQNAIVVLRMDLNKKLIAGKPCPICSSVINQYGIRTVLHS